MRTSSAKSLELPVLDSTMRVVEEGSGDPVVFLHGNPTSSYLWRQVTPPVAAAGYHCVAVDLIGMGGSGHPDIDYRFADHAEYLSALLMASPPGSAGISPRSWSATTGVRCWRCTGRESDPTRSERWRCSLSPEEHQAYREPFGTPASRRPILAWIREIPIGGSPASMVQTVTENQQVIEDPEMPVLILHADPGAVVGREEVEWCRRAGGSIALADVGPGLHFVPEDRPEQVADALIGWLSERGAPGPSAPPGARTR